MNPHPHELAPLLLALGRAGIELAQHPTDGDRLRFKCPGGPADLPPELSARLLLAKPAVLATLRGEGIPDDTDPESEGGYVMAERLGVADGMPTHPGSPAWLVAVAEWIKSLRSDERNSRQNRSVWST